VKIKKKDFAKLIAKEIDSTEKYAMDIIDVVFWGVRKVLMNLNVGDVFEVRGLFRIVMKKQKGRTNARNPKTGETLFVAPKRKIGVRWANDIADSMKKLKINKSDLF